jgi:CelD/BcsL family acetyltransferase involved in cellulose biosynthesis
MSVAQRAADDEAPGIAFEPVDAAGAPARETVAVRPEATLAAEWRPLSALTPLVNEWRALAERAIEPNVFYEPSFALAAASVFGRNAGAVLVWADGAPRKLVGLFPGRVSRRRYGLRKPVLVGWTHPYGPCGTPLVDRSVGESAIVAWLAHIVSDPRLADIVLLPAVPADGPFATALHAVLSQAQLPSADFNRHRRALLAPDSEATLSPGTAREDYLARAVPARRLKELRRQRRRLADTGKVTFTTTRGVFGIDDALADYLRLEADGWKGRGGTAAAQHHDVRRFIEVAVRALAAEGKVRIDHLRVGGQAVAASVTLKSGDSAYFWKIAYDERFARSSPGVLLAAELTEQLLADPEIAHTDSCATAGHPMIDKLWRERLALADRLIAARPEADFAMARRLEALRRAAVGAARGARDLVWRR